MPLNALSSLPCLPLPAPPRSDPWQTNNKALHHIKTHRFLNQNPPYPPYLPYPQTNNHLLPQNKGWSPSSYHHLPQTTHIQLLQPRNGTPFAVGLIQPMATDSSIKTHNSQTLILLKLPKNPKSKNSHHKPNFRVLAFANPNEFDGFSWLSLTRLVWRGSEWLWLKLSESGKKEIG